MHFETRKFKWPFSFLIKFCPSHFVIFKPEDCTVRIWWIGRNSYSYTVGSSWRILTCKWAATEDQTRSPGSSSFYPSDICFQSDPCSRPFALCWSLWNKWYVRLKEDTVNAALVQNTLVLLAYLGVERLHNFLFLIFDGKRKFLE